MTRATEVFLTLDADAASRFADALEETRLMFEHTERVFELARSSAHYGRGEFDPFAWGSVFELCRRALASAADYELKQLDDFGAMLRQGLGRARHKDQVFAAAMAGQFPTEAADATPSKEP